MLKRFFISILLIIFSITNGAAEPSSPPPGNLTLLTEEYPPYNFRQEGKLTGFAVDLMVLMLEKLDSGIGRDDIKLLPWARGYQIVKTKKNSVLFAMSRTPSRETVFKWVGPIESNKISLMARQDFTQIIIGSSFLLNTFYFL